MGTKCCFTGLNLGVKSFVSGVAHFANNKGRASRTPKARIVGTMDDYYDVLEVSRQATYEEIKASYQKLALAHHPDIKRTTCC